jgi:hypothetical protein
MHWQACTVTQPYRVPSFEQMTTAVMPTDPEAGNGLKDKPVRVQQIASNILVPVLKMFGRTCREQQPVLVIDIFAGTGSTGHAAYLLGCPVILVEIDEDLATQVRKRMNLLIEDGYGDTDKNHKDAGHELVSLNDVISRANASPIKSPGKGTQKRSGKQSGTQASVTTLSSTFGTSMSQESLAPDEEDSDGTDHDQGEPKWSVPEAQTTSDGTFQEGTDTGEATESKKQPGAKRKGNGIDGRDEQEGTGETDEQPTKQQKTTRDKQEETSETDEQPTKQQKTAPNAGDTSEGETSDIDDDEVSVNKGKVKGDKKKQATRKRLTQKGKTVRKEKKEQGKGDTKDEAREPPATRTSGRKK